MIYLHNSSKSTFRHMNIDLGSHIFLGVQVILCYLTAVLSIQTSSWILVPQNNSFLHIVMTLFLDLEHLKVFLVISKCLLGKYFFWEAFLGKSPLSPVCVSWKYLRDRYSCESAFWTKYDKLRSESAVSILLDEHVLWLYCTMIILTNDAPYFKYKCTSSVSRTTR